MGFQIDSGRAESENGTGEGMSQEVELGRDSLSASHNDERLIFTQPGVSEHIGLVERSKDAPFAAYLHTSSPSPLFDYTLPSSAENMHACLYSLTTALENGLSRSSRRSRPGHPYRPRCQRLGVFRSRG